MKFLALVNLLGDKGIMLGVEAKTKHDLEGMMNFIQLIQKSASGGGSTVESVTIVNTVSKRPSEPYVHPAMASGFAPDKSIQMGGKKWLELILSVNLLEEEE